MDNMIYSALMIGVIALVTALLRFLPFWIFSGRRPIPRVVQYLGTVLPYSVMGMLVVYCLKGVSFGAVEQWLAPAIAVAAVVVLHVWKRNTLLSIVAGTACYMLLLRFL